MQQKKARFVTSGFAAAMLMAAASSTLAGGGAPPTLPTPGPGADSADGVVAGQGRFPDEVFVYANKDSSNPGGPALQSQCAGSNTRADIKDMKVAFRTRTSGLAEVTFCGVVDQWGGSNLGLRALIDSEPGADVQCQPGDIYWNQNASNGDGPVCFTWLCQVDNDPCGKNPNGNTCWTDHEVKVQCGTDSGSADFGDALISERSLRVRYTANN